MLDELGFAGDDLDPSIDELETGLGSVSVFRDRRRATLQAAKAAKELVYKRRPRLEEAT